MSYWSIPTSVAQCCSALMNAGYEAYPVGGCVRDLLLGRTPVDWDVTTSARPEQVMALFDRTIPTGIKHGTVTVVSEDILIEVTTFRQDGEYRDSRHPDHVSFETDLAGDLSRRDFTVNAMAIDVFGNVIDPFGGQKDLKNRLIRAVGDPGQRFSEDALRILRGVRLAAQLDFDIEHGTFEAMEKYAPLTVCLAKERIKSEVEKILCSHAPQRIKQLVDLGVLKQFGNEWQNCPWDDLKKVPPIPTERWIAFCRMTGFSVSVFPLEREIKMAVTHPERRAVKELRLSSGELQKMGFRGKEIGAAQRRLAMHILQHPQDNTPLRLKEILESDIQERRGGDYETVD